MLESSNLVLRGIGVNFIITLMASIAPLLFGIAMVFPSRFNTNYSIGKNIVVNVLGLFADIFKWSLVVGYIGVIDLLRENTMQMARTYEPSVYIGGFIVSLIVLLIINGLKLLFEEIMK